MTTRTYFIDRLRVLLTALVICFHVAIAYGSAGGWYWREVDDLSRPLSIALTVFTAVCQAFFGQRLPRPYGAPFRFIAGGCSRHWPSPLAPGRSGCGFRWDAMWPG
jgi:hypothetical protein